MEKIIDIRPSKIESEIVYAPFDEALAELGNDGYQLIGLPLNAQLRILEGEDAYVSKKGNYVREGLICRPNNTPRLVRDSPILKFARVATNANRNNQEFYLTDLVDEALADSIELPDGNIEIPTDRFGDGEFKIGDYEAGKLTIFAFGGEEQARAYGEFLKDAGISKMPVWVVDKNYVDKQSKPFARQLGFGGLGDCGSCLDGNFRWLVIVDRVRGVRSVAPKAQDS